jgi:hypothetical protein
MKKYEDETHSTDDGDGKCIEKFSQPHPHIDGMIIKKDVKRKKMCNGLG